MKKIFSLCVGLIFCNLGILSAQYGDITVRGIDLNMVQQMTQDSNGVYYHPELVRQFENSPEKLKKIDFLMLYYGQAFVDSYDPYKHFAWEDSLASLNEQEKFVEVLDLADQILAENPVSLFANIEKAIALQARGDEVNSRLYLERYRVLVETLESSGRGDSYETPIVSISPKDPQAIILRYKLSELSKSLNGKGDRYYDVYLVRNEEEKQYPIFFDITLCRTIGMEKFKADLKKEE